ncbi:cupin domain-containing protein [Methylobacter svalbardensis]|uniref:cupin domain-containing protein n=1 Tax=Methylobacter svalbardensis TaxID=3080016 RepID=UPI0030ED6F5D
MQPTRYFPLTLIAVAIISGCSTVPNQSLNDAHSNYNNARSNPDVTNLAALEISRADKSAPVLNGIERPMGQSNKEGIIMKGFVQDIEDLAIKNDEFRRVIYTAKHCQLVLMALKPKEEIGAEVHKLDQFFRVEEGAGEAVLDGVRTAIRAGFAVVVPAGTKHNIINTGSVPLKLYTLYAPPNHRDGIVHHTREDAEADNEHFDGKTTE